MKSISKLSEVQHVLMIKVQVGILSKNVHFTRSENSYERYTSRHDFCRKCERGRDEMCNVRNCFLTKLCTFRMYAH